MRSICTLLLLLLPSVSWAQNVPEISDGKVIGASFTIALPPNVVAEISATPETLHGFQIDLTPHFSGAVLRKTGAPSTFRYIAFDTRWDAGDMPSLEAVVQDITSHVLKYVPEELVGSGDLSLTGNLPARLGSLPARRLVMSYRNSDKRPSIRQMIVAYHARADASGIIYLLTLNTTQENFQEDLTVFGKVLSGFKLTSP
jgi:hypothetical protein